MACVDQLFTGDSGTSLKFKMAECAGNVQIAMDLTDVVDIVIRFIKPNGLTMDVPGTVYLGGPNGTPSDGIVEYITQAGDIDTAGDWKSQVKLTFPTGVFSSSINESLVVAENL